MTEPSPEGLFPSLSLDKSSKTPLYQQLGAAIRALAEKGVLKPHQKLPPIRKLAETLGVNAVTVVNAYKTLESDGFVYSTVGSGTYIAERRPAMLAAPAVFNKRSRATDC
ncbi:MAG: GntR family transcriptional regulator [Clostridiales bacterium]|nr:GntR family transcriptional regulator [Clostridiales bacterium]